MNAKRRYGSIMELYDDFKVSVKFGLPRSGGTGWADSYSSFFELLKDDGWLFKKRERHDAWRILFERDRITGLPYHWCADTPPAFYDYYFACDDRKVHGVCLCHESGLEVFVLALAGTVAAYYTIKVLDSLLKKTKKFTFTADDLEAKVEELRFRTKAFGSIVVKIEDIDEEDLESLVCWIDRQQNLDQLPTKLLCKLDFQVRVRTWRSESRE